MIQVDGKDDASNASNASSNASSNTSANASEKASNNAREKGGKDKPEKVHPLNDPDRSGWIEQDVRKD